MRSYSDLVFDFVDRLIFNPLIQDCTDEELAEVKKAGEDETDIKYRDFIYTMMDAADSKASALLTHISLLVAALAILYSNASLSAGFRFVITVEICLYLVLTIPCLRAIRMTANVSKGLPAGSGDNLARELVRRRKAYSFALTSTIVVTGVTMLTLVLGTLLGAGAKS